MRYLIAFFLYTIAFNARAQNQSPEIGVSQKLCQERIISSKLTYQIFGFKVFSADTAKIFTLFSSDPSFEVKDVPSDNTSKLYYYTFNGNSLCLFHKVDEGFYIESAFISTSDLKLGNGLKVGMLKRDFFKLLKRPVATCNLLIANDAELGLETKFFFKEGRLKSIQMQQLLE